MLREDKTAMEREVRDLRQRVDVPQRECHEAKRDALDEKKVNVEVQELLRVEREKVKVLQEQLKTSRQWHLVPEIASATAQFDQSTPTPVKDLVSIDLALLNSENSGNPVLNNMQESVPGLILFPPSHYLDSLPTQHHRQAQTQAVAMPVEMSGVDHTLIHELDATPIPESLSHAIAELGY